VQVSPFVFVHEGLVEMLEAGGPIDFVVEGFLDTSVIYGLDEVLFYFGGVADKSYLLCWNILWGIGFGSFFKGVADSHGLSDSQLVQFEGRLYSAVEDGKGSAGQLLGLRWSSKM
jgi:hypothetical protein